MLNGGTLNRSSLVGDAARDRMIGIQPVNSI
jgi:hypothetical protein